MGTQGPNAVLGLDEPAAHDARIAGSKAACLAEAIRAGFPVSPGFVIPAASADHRVEPTRDAWADLSDRGRLPLVVRSSSTIEDTSGSSMAGRFRSVTGVLGWDAYADACAAVDRSGRSVDPAAPMAILVQREVASARGGVLFGVDPVTGARDHLVVESLAGSPADVVSGTAIAERIAIGRHGRLRRSEGVGACAIGRRDRRRLARMGTGLERVFGGPQDVEWSIDPDGRLWLLQSRPVTAVGEATAAEGPVFGPGPVGETFPEPLAPLEVDLFLEPMRLGMIEALHAVGVVPRRRIEASPVLMTVGGRVAADLELLGWSRGRRHALAILNPAPPLRHLAAAWHVGRLRASLPGLVEDLVRATDASLRAVPELRTLDDRELVSVIGSVRRQLIAVHGHQILAGMLLPSADDRTSAATLAMPAVAARRRAGEADEAIVSRVPLVLALVPPRVGPPGSLPPVRVTPGDPAPDVRALAPREALRLRARWLDELAARAAWEICRRLRAAGRLGSGDDVRFLGWEELGWIVGGGAVPDDLGSRRAGRPSAPLPATFRLTPSGAVVPQGPPAGGGGTGAGGGRAEGPVRLEGDRLGPGDILVVRVLSPALAPELPGLAGLVSETGSTLSHLAIVARELGVPTVVAVPDATDRFRRGERIVIDGRTGEVTSADRSQEVSSR
jgi:pyruvate,water dikinase